MQPTRGKNTRRSAEGTADHVQPPSSQGNTSSTLGRNKRTRPHSKTTVVGTSLKTRLHCNHLMSKCKCSSITNRKKTHKTKHVVQGGGFQRRVLNSSRVLPRGEMNGRKIYQSTDESLSVCDDTRRPNLNNSEDSSKTNSEKHHNKCKNGGEKVLQKKLRFEDEVTELNGHIHGQMTNSVKDIMNTNKSPKDDNIQLSSCTQVPSIHYRAKSCKNLERKTKETSGEYCRLCESPDMTYCNGSKGIKKKDKVYNNKTDTSKLYSKDNFSSHNELCFLCQRYGNHKCVHDDHYCKICNTHVYCSQEDITEHEHSVHHQDSPSTQVTDDQGKNIPLNTIPYEPRTKFVKNLKEKLETTYMKDKSKQRGTNVETSAALSDTASCYRESYRHQANQAHHKHHGRKCLHHYQQNDRLFLEPTLTNRKGQSVCVECGASQPEDPYKDPYLYHITLGGLKTNTNKGHSTASVNRFSNRGKENSRTSNMKSMKVSNDKAKFLYAKLNDSIDNILGRTDIRTAFSRPSAPLNYPAPSYSKRHPSRSMALMDHII